MLKSFMIFLATESSIIHYENSIKNNVFKNEIKNEKEKKILGSFQLLIKKVRVSINHFFIAIIIGLSVIVSAFHIWPFVNKDQCILKISNTWISSKQKNLKDFSEHVNTFCYTFRINYPISISKKKEFLYINTLTKKYYIKSEEQYIHILCEILSKLIEKIFPTKLQTYSLCPTEQFKHLLLLMKKITNFGKISNSSYTSFENHKISYTEKNTSTNYNSSEKCNLEDLESFLPIYEQQVMKSFENEYESNQKKVYSLCKLITEKWFSYHFNKLNENHNAIENAMIKTVINKIGSSFKDFTKVPEIKDSFLGRNSFNEIEDTIEPLYHLAELTYFYFVALKMVKKKDFYKEFKSYFPVEMEEWNKFYNIVESMFPKYNVSNIKDLDLNTTRLDPSITKSTYNLKETFSELIRELVINPSKKTIDILIKGIENAEKVDKESINQIKQFEELNIGKEIEGLLNISKNGDSITETKLTYVRLEMLFIIEKIRNTSDRRKKIYWTLLLVEKINTFFYQVKNQHIKNKNYLKFFLHTIKKIVLTIKSVFSFEITMLGEKSKICSDLQNLLIEFINTIGLSEVEDFNTVSNSDTIYDTFNKIKKLARSLSINKENISSLKGYCGTFLILSITQNLEELFYSKKIENEKDFFFYNLRWITDIPNISIDQRFDCWIGYIGSEEEDLQNLNDEKRKRIILRSCNYLMQTILNSIKKFKYYEICYNIEDIFFHCDIVSKSIFSILSDRDEPVEEKLKQLFDSIANAIIKFLSTDIVIKEEFNKKKEKVKENFVSRLLDIVDLAIDKIMVKGSKYEEKNKELELSIKTIVEKIGKIQKEDTEIGTEKISNLISSIEEIPIDSEEIPIDSEEIPIKTAETQKIIEGKKNLLQKEFTAYCVFYIIKSMEDVIFFYLEEIANELFEICKKSIDLSTRINKIKTRAFKNHTDDTKETYLEKKTYIDQIKNIFGEKKNILEFSVIKESIDSLLDIFFLEDEIKKCKKFNNCQKDLLSLIKEVDLNVFFRENKYFSILKKEDSCFFYKTNDQILTFSIIASLSENKNILFDRAFANYEDKSSSANEICNHDYGSAEELLVHFIAEHPEIVSIIKGDESEESLFQLFISKEKSLILPFFHLIPEEKRDILQHYMAQYFLKGKYNPSINGQNYSFVLPDPLLCSKEELEYITYLIIPHANNVIIERNINNAHSKIDLNSDVKITKKMIINLLKSIWFGINYAISEHLKLSKLWFIEGSYRKMSQWGEVCILPPLKANIQSNIFDIKCRKNGFFYLSCTNKKEADQCISSISSSSLAKSILVSEINFKNKEEFTFSDLKRPVALVSSKLFIYGDCENNVEEFCKKRNKISMYSRIKKSNKREVSSWLHYIILLLELSLFASIIVAGNMHSEKSKNFSMLFVYASIGSLVAIMFLNIGLYAKIYFMNSTFSTAWLILFQLFPAVFLFLGARSD